MAVGNIIYVTVGYTQSDNASTRKGYPIKRKYKQTENTQSPKFPSSYTEVPPATLYWFPFLTIKAPDENYIEYEAGDEYGWSDVQSKRAPQIPYTNPRTAKYDDFYSTGHKIVYAGSLYVATRYTFSWNDTKFGISENPYKRATIRKWRRFTDTSDTWTQYWYHPLLRKFYLLAEIDELQELPDFDEPSQSRWDRFVGDSEDMNLENFTFAQIRELVSVGSALSTATSAVQSIEERSMAALAVAQRDGVNVRTSAVQTSGTFVINNQAGGQNGQGILLPDNLPKMIQRMTTGKSGVKTVLDTYVFNLRPNNVSYSNIGITWTEIDRVNNFPLVDYRNYKLMKISFEFVVESQEQGISSLYESCEARLRQVQRMANRPELLVFSNFDSLFGEGVFNETSTATYREWAIVDMSVNSIQRTPSGVNTSPGAISRATVSMTIQEVRLTPDQVIFMPKLRKTPGVPNIPTPENEPEPCIEYATDTVVEVNSKLKYSACWYKNRGLPVPSS
jgi:hypothetical protein